MINTILKGLQVLIRPTKLWQTPPWLGLEITTKCNSRCRTCNWTNYSKVTPKSTSLNIEQFKVIINKTKPKILSLSGVGETLLNQDYFKMVEYAVKKGIRVYSTTNGILLKKYAKQLCSCGLHELVISMDGYDAKSYKEIRGVECYNRVIEGIESLNKEIRFQNSSLELGFNVVVQDTNYEFLDNIVETAFKHNISIINFLPLDIHSEYINNHKYAMSIDNNRLNGSIKKSIKRASELKIVTNSRFWEKHYEEIWKKMNLANGENITNKICHHPWSGTFIYSNGNVSPCCILAPEKYIFGNIFENSLSEILNTKKATSFRRELLQRKKPFSDCKECIVIPFHEMIMDLYRRKLL